MTPACFVPRPPLEWGLTRTEEEILVLWLAQGFENSTAFAAAFFGKKALGYDQRNLFRVHFAHLRRKLRDAGFDAPRRTRGGAPIPRLRLVEAHCPSKIVRAGART